MFISNSFELLLYQDKNQASIVFFIDFLRYFFRVVYPIFFQKLHLFSIAVRLCFSWSYQAIAFFHVSCIIDWNSLTIEDVAFTYKNLIYFFPSIQYRTFTNPSEAKQYVKEQGAPIVVKADGLAAGKGVIVAMSIDEAYEAIDSMLVTGAFGNAGSRVIIEEFLEGEEASFFALVDGQNALPLESAQDHKRVGDGDTGPNTGGMGAYSPAPVLTQELQSIVMEKIIHPTVKGMAAEGCKFVGVLYAGLMIEKKSGLPKLIEYNVRFGDPECQVSHKFIMFPHVL